MKIPDENDWRLAIHERESFEGLALEWRRWASGAAVTWSAASDEPESSVWDHDHCTFCYATFSSPHPDNPEILEEGYVSISEPELPETGPRGMDRGQVESLKDMGFRVQSAVEPELWVCSTCFEDFRDYFGWTVEKPGK